MRTACLPWFALHVKSRQERVVSSALRCRGYEVFAPVLEMTRRWSDRTKRVEEPLFPGYLFCRLDVRRKLPVLKIPAVVSIVGLGGTPLPVAQEEVAAIEAALRSGLPVSRRNRVTTGTVVDIEAGPLAGIRGTLVALKNQHRLLVSVALLQRSVAVEIDTSTARPVTVPGNGADTPAAMRRRL